jgi:transcriptional regulator with XRE-family HTH domain
MISDESPAVARRRLRLALRQAREAKGMTRVQVADEFEWSLSKVNRIEAGEVAVSNPDLRALLRLYGVTDEDRIAELLEDARASRRRGWWDEPKYRDHLTPATVQLLQFESQATAIRVFQPGLIPGILQIRRYAETVLNSLSDLPDVERPLRLEVRLRRASQVFDRADPPEYFLVIDESVPLREVGGVGVMVKQLQELLDHVRKGAVMVRVLPMAQGGIPTTLGSFTIFDLGDEENAVLYRESAIGDEMVHASEVIVRHRAIFETLWNQSLNVSASTRLIEARVATMLSSLDRGAYQS